jgi:predicted permease
LVRQLLTESLILGLLGGAASTLVAFWGINLLDWFMPDSFLPIFRELHLEPNALLFAMLLAIMSSMLLGLFPSLQLLRGSFQDTLKTEGRTAGVTGSRQRLRNALIVTEMALATLLLIGAGLCLKSFQKARQVQRGFNPENVLVAPVAVPSGDYDENELRGYYRRLLDAARSIPSVENIGSGNWLLLGFQGTQDAYLRVEQYQPKPGENMSYPYSVISPGFFKTLEIPLLEGRGFSEADDRQAPDVVIINETMARRLWPGQIATGRRITWGDRSFRVIGVAGNSKYSRLDEPPLPFMFFNFLQVHGGGQILYVRSHEDPVRLIQTLEKLTQSLDPNFHLYNPLPMTHHLQGATINQRIAAQLLLALGAVALLLAALGIYGVLAYVVAQRTREIGVRMALGATPAAILSMVMRQGLRFVLVGILLGLLLASVLSRHFAGLLLGIQPTDPFVYTAVTVFFSLVGVWACYLPARQATRVDPNVALHSE